MNDGMNDVVNDRTSGLASDAILDRMMALHPKIIDLTLDRVWRLLERLDNPQDRLPPVIHIAGTNGKGSTLAMIRAGLEGEGHRVHTYTSPHLARFHERIGLAGDWTRQTWSTAQRSPSSPRWTWITSNSWATPCHRLPPKRPGSSSAACPASSGVSMTPRCR